MAAVETIRDLPEITEEMAQALETNGIDTLSQLSQTAPKEISRITGLSGMNSIIVKEKAERAIERGAEASGAKKMMMKAKNTGLSKNAKSRTQMKISSMVSNVFRKF